jgi:hypothetical protein
MHVGRRDIADVDVPRGGARERLSKQSHRRVDRVDAAFVQRHLVTWRIMHKICRAAHGSHTSLALLSQPSTLSFHIHFDRVFNI